MTGQKRSGRFRFGLKSSGVQPEAGMLPIIYKEVVS